MTFFADLDWFTIFCTILVLVLAFIYMGLLFGSYGGKWPGRNTRPLGLLLGVAVVACFPAWDAYCPDANQPHIRTTGPVVRLKSYTYTRSKSPLHTGLLACIGPCGSKVPVLEFDEPTTYTIKYRVHDQPVTVVYLARKEEVNIGGGYAMSAHPVVEMDGALTGERFLYVDTTRHWPRAIVLVSDALIGLVAFLICVLAGRSRSEVEEDDGNSSSDPVESTTNELTSLGLEKRD